LKQNLGKIARQKEPWNAPWEYFKIGADHYRAELEHVEGIDPKKVEAFQSRTTYALPLDQEVEGEQASA
jgi:hypothetical protein